MAANIKLSDCLIAIIMATSFAVIMCPVYTVQYFPIRPKLSSGVP